MLAPSDLAASGTVRARLAHLALEAALVTDGVVAADAGPRATHVTPAGGVLLRGVRATADGGGRHAVDLGLRARLVPLPALAEAVRARVRRATEIAGLGAALGDVTVTFHAVLDDDDVLALAAASAPPAPGPPATTTPPVAP